jgi:hypothetical protein
LCIGPIVAVLIQNSSVWKTTSTMSLLYPNCLLEMMRSNNHVKSTQPTIGIDCHFGYGPMNKPSGCVMASSHPRPAFRSTSDPSPARSATVIIIIETSLLVSGIRYLRVPGFRSISSAPSHSPTHQIAGGALIHATVARHRLITFFFLVQRSMPRKRNAARQEQKEHWTYAGLMIID